MRGGIPGLLKLSRAFGGPSSATIAYAQALVAQTTESSSVR